MHRLNVRHQALPGIGDRFELDTSSGSTITVISHRSGRRDIAIARPDGEGPSITTELTDAEAAAVAMLLAGVHIELAMTARD